MKLTQRYVQWQLTKTKHKNTEDDSLMLISMGQKAKAQMLITMIGYFRVLKNMDNIYGVS